MSKINLSIKIGCDEFYSHFATVAENILSKISAQNIDALNINMENNMSRELFDFSYITEDMVSYSIMCLKNTSSMDVFNINSKLVKETSHILTPLLTHLFNSCLLSGKFPDLLQCAKVVPHFKKGNKSDLNNCRPISIISIFGKLLEIIPKELLSLNTHILLQ